MDNWPPVIILLITYRRLPLALATVRSIKERLIYPNIGWHIADDGSGGDYIQRIIDEIGPSYSIKVSDAARGGVGKSMNLGIAGCLNRADLWLHLEDDWILPRPLELAPCVHLLNDNAGIGMVRLGRLQANMRASSFSSVGHIWWALQKKSEPYIFTGNPSLRHRRFHETYGPYVEGLSPGHTEVSYCSQFNEKEGPSIVWPAWISCEETFQHIGDHQSFKWWMEAGGKTAEEAATIFEGMATNV